jgi:hypothetical protein
MPRARVENEFHAAIWSLANEWSRCELAISEARDICDMLTQHPDQTDLHKTLAERWLERFGA